MYEIVYLDELLQDKKQLVEVTKAFKEQCTLADYEGELKGIENINDFLYLNELEYAPFWKTELGSKSKDVCIFQCKAFFDDRLLVVIPSSFYPKNNAKVLFSCHHFIRVEYRQFSSRFYIESLNQERSATVEQLNIITTYRSTLGNLNYKTFKERNDLDTSIEF